MKRSETSGFNPVVDNRSEGGVLWLLIAATAASALISAALSLPAYLGWPVPAAVPFYLGLIIGAALGALVQRSLARR